MISIFLALTWVIGGMSLDHDATIFFGTLVGLIWWGIGYSKKRRIYIPTLFKYYVLLIILEAVSIFWSKDQLVTLRNLILLISGGVWWLATLTWKPLDTQGKHIQFSLYISGSIFLFLWLLQSFFHWPSNLYGPSSLIMEASAYLNHNHLGDWWMLIAVLTTSTGFTWLLPAMAIIFVSRSRSAVIGLLCGWGYWIFVNKTWRRQHRLLIIFTISVMAATMIFLGSQKSSLNDRDYYVQSLVGLIKYPFGVGLGNFTVISKDIETHWWGRNNYSSVAHNILFEWTAGAGILGFSGWIWLAIASWQFGLPNRTSTHVWRSLYWAFLLNFLLDTTYFIPSMWWLFMIVMGMSEGDTSK